MNGDDTPQDEGRGAIGWAVGVMCVASWGVMLWQWWA